LFSLSKKISAALIVERDLSARRLCMQKRRDRAIRFVKPNSSYALPEEQVASTGRR
jgi:hypothetical protein